MNKKLWIAVLVASATLTSAAYAHGGDRGWGDQRHDHWQHQRHDHWRHDHRHDHWGHRPPPGYAYGYGHDYRPAPQHFDGGPVAHLPLPPLPPSPFEVHRAIRDRLFGRH